MLAAAGSPLVAGMARPNAMANTVTVKVLRAFCIKGEPVKVGKEIEVDRVLAAELIGAQKAAAVVKAPPAAPATKPAAAPPANP